MSFCVDRDVAMVDDDDYIGFVLPCKVVLNDWFVFNTLLFYVRFLFGVQGVLIVFFSCDVGVYCHDVIEEVFHCFYQDCSGWDFLSDHL